MVQVGWDVDNLKLLFKDGKVCESCCAPTDPAPWSCSPCVFTPNTIDVLISGIVGCTNCIYTAAASYKIDGSPTADGIYTLTAHPTQTCRWSYSAIIGQYKIYPTTICTGTPTYNNLSLGINAQMNASLILLSVTINTLGYSKSQDYNEGDDCLSPTGSSTYLDSGNVGCTSPQSGASLFDYSGATINLI